MSLLDVAIVVGSAFRLTRLMVMDDFPHVVAFRRRLVKRTGAESSWVGLAACGHCSSFWLAGGVLGLFHFVPWTRPLLAVLAISALVGLVADREWD